MWNALKRGNSTSSEMEQEPVRLAPVGDAEPMLVASDEIPFIEVGPHKSIEASPSVLASAPPMRQSISAGVVTASRAATGGPARLAGPKEAPSAPRSVPFRAVFLATPEMEAQTPQDDPLAQLITFL
jgi:hypothetical protein